MRRSVFFMIYSLGVGGVEKSLLNLISSPDFKGCDIHIGLLSDKGAFREFLPENVTIHTLDGYDKMRQLVDKPIRYNALQTLKGFEVIKSLKLAYYFLVEKLSGNRLPYLKYILKGIGGVDCSFDEAHAYAGPSEVIDAIVNFKIEAREKFGWVHFDISKFGINVDTTRRLYRRYEKIFVVSAAAKEKFDSRLPQLSKKTVLRPNIINVSLIRKLAQEAQTFDDGFEGIRLLTVGRLSPEKGQDIAVRAMAEILKHRSDVRWYFVGDGDWAAHCKALAADLGVSDHILFLGAQMNPYCYMRDCDVYVQTSRHEGFCITLGEAIVFGKPIVSTDFCGAKEQLRSYPQAYICDSDPTSMAESLIKCVEAI